MSDLKLYVIRLSAGQMRIDVELSTEIKDALFAALNAGVEGRNNQARFVEACEKATSGGGVFETTFNVPETAVGRDGVPARLKAIRLHRG